MSKGGKKSVRQIFGHSLTKREFGVVSNLIGMTIGRFHIPKRMVKNENRLWTGVKLITGNGPKDGELFINAVFRIHYWLTEMSKAERDKMVASVDRAAFHETMETLLTGRDREQYLALRTPVACRQSRGSATPTVDAKQEFYKSWEWRTLRLEVLKEQGRVCGCCGNRPGMFYASGEPVRVVVDHIKPISKHWHLRLEKSNLQPLCDECNMGKGNWDETDFRSPEAPDEWIEAPLEDIVLSVLDQLNAGTVQ